ncbi:TPA: hypothetical protein IAB95_07240 [Candidatus Ventrenecus avicola]|nr:hypothetical protein [Candidatus Ventrenecus avicola]
MAERLVMIVIFYLFFRLLDKVVKKFVKMIKRILKDYYVKKGVIKNDVSE